MFKVIFLLTIFASAAESNISYKMYSASTKKYQEIPLIKQKNILISKTCVKSGKLKCAAWEATLVKKTPLPRKKFGPLGHPAALYCTAYGAKNRILLGPKGIEDDFCVFKDGSIVMAWDLYNTHFPKK